VEVLILLVLVSVCLAAGGVGFFVWNVRQEAHQHTDRLSLLPLQDEPEPPRGTSRAPAAPAPGTASTADAQQEE
jgi:cbb3-type cytochrome oxidase maturation protein